MQTKTAPAVANASSLVSRRLVDPAIVDDGATLDGDRSGCSNDAGNDGDDRKAAKTRMESHFPQDKTKSVTNIKGGSVITEIHNGRYFSNEG